MPSLTDTHCHIHEILGDDDVAKKWHDGGITDVKPVLKAAREAGVDRMLCIGCTVPDSGLAVQFAAKHDGVWASIGIHPHEAAEYSRNQAQLAAFAALAKQPKVVAIGECGLDYFYNHSPKPDQQAILHFQLRLAQEHKLPMVFHVREAFDDFWPIFDQYPGITGVIHSFTASTQELEQILRRGLYVGLNGIMTFTKHVKQLDAAKAVPLDHLLLETDAPFLTPQPFRGTICEPKHTIATARFLAELRGENLDDLIQATTANASTLFGIR